VGPIERNTILTDYYVASNMSAKTLRPSTQPSGYAANQTPLIEPAFGGCTLIPSHQKWACTRLGSKKHAD
jgi:hypothetical protein